MNPSPRLQQRGGPPEIGVVSTEPILPSRPDYPRTPSEFAEFFPNEEACERYVERLRWPNGFVCPKCGRAGTPWRSARGALCRKCRSRASLTAGTVLEGTHKPISFWLSAAWEMAAHPGGVNARAIQHSLGLGSYQTAWSWLHKLRRAMAPDTEPLMGRVGIGRVRLAVRGSSAARKRGAKKVIVGVVVELVGRRRIGRVRVGRLKSASGEALTDFVNRHVGVASEVVTSDADPAVRRLGSFLHRWLLDTYQGAVSLDHLDHYLDEFAFRFNGRRGATRGVRFRSLLEHALRTDSITTRELFRANQD